MSEATFSGCKENVSLVKHRIKATQSQPFLCCRVLDICITPKHQRWELLSGFAVVKPKKFWLSLEPVFKDWHEVTKGVGAPSVKIQSEITDGDVKWWETTDERGKQRSMRKAQVSHCSSWLIILIIHWGNCFSRTKRVFPFYTIAWKGFLQKRCEKKWLLFKDDIRQAESINKTCSKPADLFPLDFKKD